MTVPRVASFHASKDAQATLDGLQRAVLRAEGIGLMIGGTGTGKSLLLACLREQLEDRFAVALLSGARICTRRGLWQSIMADIGEAYRGLDEEELRIGLVDRIRGLAALGAGLVVLVDEAHTLPRRLLEELRLLAGVVAAQPAVHLVLAGTVRLEEMLGEPELEGVAQRIAVRGYLEPLDYEETCGYLRTQMRAAGLEWSSHFAADCDAAVFTLTDGVPRLINQVCDQALRLAEQQGTSRVGTADLAAAWEETQRLPPPAALQAAAPPLAQPESLPDAEATFADAEDCGDNTAATIIEFGTFDDDDEDLPAEAAVNLGPTAGVSEMPLEPGVTAAFIEEPDWQAAHPEAEAEAETPRSIDFAASREATEYAARALLAAAGGRLEGAADDEVMLTTRTIRQAEGSGWQDDEIELIFDPPFDAEDDTDRVDPFAEVFAEEEDVVERFVMAGPDDFHERLHVASREGQAISRQLPPGPAAVPPAAAAASVEAVPAVDAVHAVDEDVEQAGEDEADVTDADMVLIEEDDHPDPNVPDQAIQAVRLGDYSRLFVRLRRGGQLETSRRA